MFDVTCGWGEGIDVLITNKGEWYMAYDELSEFDRCTHGVSKSGSIQLSRKQARELAYDLIRAANYCDELDASYESYIEEDRKNRPELYKNEKSGS